MPPPKPVERSREPPAPAARQERGLPSEPRAASFSLLLVLFVASGAAGLIYQVLWFRILSLTLSVSVYAVTTVLVAFMTGLALGAGIAGRMVDRIERPLLGYGLVEIGVAAVAVVTPAILFHLGPLYRDLVAALGGSGPTFVAARFLLAFGVLLVPMHADGRDAAAAQPRRGRPRRERGRRVGALYAVNTPARSRAASSPASW